MNRLSNISALVLAFTLLGSGLYAQGEYVMTNGQDNTCSGLFFDDGGSASGYSTTTYTYTICPDSPGDVIQVDFYAFALWQSPNPNNSDRLSIFDGPDDTAPSLGSYTGNQLQGSQITGTIFNPTGCLTFVFYANPNGNTAGDFPGWEAGILCTTPCATPTANSEILDPAPDGPDQIIGACIGDPITFADNGSFAEPGFTIEKYLWNFDDGTIDTTSGTQVTHVFNDPGEYIVTLTVFDDNGCASINVDPLQVLISTLPVFNTEFDDEICLGESSILNGSPITSQTWTSLPPQVVSSETYLPDGSGFSYDTSILFDYFEPGATLENCDDLLGVYINMEHSWVGDLNMQISCPDGTTVNILSFPNNGNSTYLGEAVDVGEPAGEVIPGIGYTYTWTPSSTNGTIDNQPDNTVSFTNQAGFDDTYNIVPEGTYEAEGDLCNLVGCPLNGTWTFTITDNWNIDNGYVFYWGIDFNPAYFPDVTTITPVIGMGPDSTFWSGPNLGNTSADGNTTEFTPDATGQYNFTFTAMNNFGCEQDTTITVNVVPGPDTDAGEPLVICQDSLQLSGGIAGIPPPPPTCDYTLDMHDTFGDGWSGFTVIVLIDGVQVGTYSITGAEGTATIPVTHGSTIQINTTNGSWLGEISYELLNAAGEIVFSDGGGATNVQVGNNIFNGIVDCQPGVPDYVFEWSPAMGLSDPNIADPMVYVEQTTTYTLTAYDILHPLCATTDTVTVTFIPNLNPGEDNLVQLCYFDDPIDINEGLLGGTPTLGGTWTDINGDELNPLVFDPADLPNGGTVVYTYTVGLGDCEFSSELTIEVQTSAENPACCITNAVVGDSFEICDLTAALSAEDPLGTGIWTSDLPGAVFADANDPNTTVTVPSGGLYTFTFTDNNGVNCSASDAMTVHFSPEIEFVQLSIENPTCIGACNGSVSYSVTGGIAPLSYSWSGGVPTPGSPDAATGFCDGTYTLTVTDAIGCWDTTHFSFVNPPPPPVEATSTNPTCAGDCDGSVTITSPNAVQYSFDAGATYGPEPTLDSLCAGSYHVGMIDADGCKNTTIVEILDPLPVLARFDFSPKPISVLHPVVQFRDLSTPAPVDSVYWTFGVGELLATSSQRNPQYEFPSDTAGSYSVMLVATNEVGCIDTTIQMLYVEEEFLFYVPNSFTPNGDGINDIWKPKGNNIDPNSYHLQIFDRYGHLVFETRELEEGWDGDVDAGGYFGQNAVYVYRITAASATTLEEKEFKGHITLIR